MSAVVDVAVRLAYVALLVVGLFALVMLAYDVYADWRDARDRRRAAAPPRGRDR